jgi:chromosome segregation ATPase
MMPSPSVKRRAIFRQYVKQETAALEAKIASLESLLAEAEECEKCATLEATAESLRQKHEQSAELIDSLMLQVAEKSKMVDDLTDHVSSLKDELDGLEAECERLETKLQEAEKPKAKAKTAKTRKKK